MYNFNFNVNCSCVIVGCQNTPAKESRYCSLHKHHATTFKDDVATSENTQKDETDTLIVKILNEKCTRLGNIYEVIIHV